MKGTIKEHDYKCELDTGCYGDQYLRVYEDGDYVATFEIKGRFKKKLILKDTKRQVHNLRACHSCALEFFELLQEEVLI